MSKVIIYENEDGGSAQIVVPVVDISIVLQKDIPASARNVMVVERDAIPSDRAFRDAWRITGNQITVDMPKAREIHMNKIREGRDKMFAVLDAEWMKYTGQNNKAEADKVEAQRQVLRNLPQTTDLSKAQTPEELKAIWPDELK